MKILNISEKKLLILKFQQEILLIIDFENNLKMKDFKYLDYKRAKKIIFNV